MKANMTMAAVLLLAAAVLGFGGPAGAAEGDGPRIPALAWTARSDWQNVREQGAVGDGKADDSAAIQKVLDRVGNGTTVYFPPGTYRLTKSVRATGPLIGVSLIGHGRDTTLSWDGPVGGSVLVIDGLAESRVVGFQFEGGSKAAVGVHHYPDHRFETEVRHLHLGFRNFTIAGVLRDPKAKFSLAEAEFRNCLFENCGRGVSFTSFNDYDFTFDGCEFRRCGIGIECSHGNFYARDSHFEASSEVDIHSAPEHGSSVRRCTSVGSKAFLRHVNGVAPITVQDCHVAGWVGQAGAITLSGAPAAVFDCSFSAGPAAPAGQAPVQIGRASQRLVVSDNRVKGGGELLQAGHRGRVYVVGAGKRKGSVASAEQRFLTEDVRIAGRVLDVRRDFGAAGDGKTDDSAAIQKAIDAARAAGGRAIAYLPTGSYVITRTLQVTGGDYYVGGSGFNSCLVWRGPEGGTMIAVQDPQDVTIENLAVGNHDSGAMNNAVDILQTGGDGASRMTYDAVFVFGMYQRQPMRKGLHFRGLGGKAVVVMPHVQGNLRFIDSARATFLANCTYEGSVVVEGKDPRRGGLLGFQTRLGTSATHGLYLRDNQSIVMSDFYIEQADDGFMLEGEAGLPPGRATIQGAKVDFTHNDKARDGTVLDIRGYAGEVFLGPDQFYASLPRVPIVFRGSEKLDLYLWGCCFYKTHLEAATDPALRLHLLANEGVAIDAANRTLTHEDRAEDNVPADQYDRLAPALDDLRRLGEADLRINHPAAGR